MGTRTPAAHSQRVVTPSVAVASTSARARGSGNVRLKQPVEPVHLRLPPYPKPLVDRTNWINRVRHHMPEGLVPVANFHTSPS